MELARYVIIYIITKKQKKYGQELSRFTPWDKILERTDLLFYEGLHVGVSYGEIDFSKYVDLLIGVVPIVNLEWIQKIHRDTQERGYTTESVIDTIPRRMYDYVHYITPQFSKTQIFNVFLLLILRTPLLLVTFLHWMRVL